MLPQAYEIDQTPLKMLAQIAEQERESQRQFEAMRLKQEQNKMDLFGGTQKQILEMSSKLPYDMQRQFVASAMPAVKEIFKKGGNLQNIQQSVFDALMNMQSEVSGVAEWTTRSKDIAKQLGEQGYDPVNVEAELKRNLYNIQTDPATGQQILGPPKKVSELGNFDEYVQKHILERDGLFWDMRKGLEEVNKVNQTIKGSVDKESFTTDPTGRKRLTIDYQTEQFPWTKAVPGKDPATGKEFYYTVLDAEPVNKKDGTPILDINGKPASVITEKAYNAYVSQSPSVRKTIEAGGQQLINDENRRKFGTIFPTKDQLDNGAIDPNDAGNKVIYSRMFLTNLPSMERFKLQKDVKSSSVTDNPQKISVYAGQDPSTLPVAMQDRVNQAIAGNPEFIGANGDVTNWFSFPIFGAKEDLKTPQSVLYDKASGKFKVTLPGKNPKTYEYTPQQMIDYTITKLPDMSYTKNPTQWRSFGKNTGEPKKGSGVKWF